MSVFTAWVMDRRPESLHYTHEAREGWILTPGLLVYCLILSLFFGFYWEAYVILIPVLLVSLAMFFYPKSHIVFDLTGIHVRDRTRKEYAMIPWSAVQHMDFREGGQHDPAYMLIATVHPIAVEYILEKKTPFLSLPQKKYNADRAMEQVVRGKMSQETFEKQQLLYFTMPRSCYNKVHMLWKSAEHSRTQAEK